MTVRPYRLLLGNADPASALQTQSCTGQEVLNVKQNDVNVGWVSRAVCGVTHQRPQADTLEYGLERRTAARVESVGGGRNINVKGERHALGIA